ncbi:TlpA family protein disulfide reductase [Xanthomarina sp. F2636L]|uniref:TlpA family protein disulfide reductase n=1 Tax=Xanthomarina sp. F2636L TaxID=2996018 RepID=UPI00225E5E96|nr:redoxin domain-containing protein [Xanthomarina sp. F2636L]MCX7551862.1 redoxin domain-containing protein [Xanthomarina sp. F2636L]
MEQIENILVNTLDAETIDLINEYKSKPLLILFYNNQCLGCTGRAIPLAYQFSKEYPKLSVVAIHSSFGNQSISKQDILGIFTSKEVPFPIYFDQQSKWFDFFKCEGTPHWILLNDKAQVFRSFYGSQDNAQNRLYYAIEELLNK